jgi:flagellar hook-length control protein FliK
VPLSKGDALKTLNAVNSKDDGKSELSEEELAGLSALMAMLPHQQTSTSRAAGSDGVSATATLSSAALTQNGAGQPSLNALPGSHDKAQSAAPYQSQAKNSDPALSERAGHAGRGRNGREAGACQFLLLSLTDGTLAPIMSSHATSQTAATVATAPVLSQPLGTHEWQQSLSQHITLFTKQGQQTAELRLHPEDLGQVQISLKLDDNQAQLQMVSAHSHVRAALEAALPVCEPHWRRTAFSLRKAASAARALPGSSSPHRSSTRLRVPATPAALMKSDELLPVPAALQSARAVTVP